MQACTVRVNLYFNVSRCMLSAVHCKCRSNIFAACMNFYIEIMRNARDTVSNGRSSLVVFCKWAEFKFYFNGGWIGVSARYKHTTNRMQILVLGFELLQMLEESQIMFTHERKSYKIHHTEYQLLCGLKHNDIYVYHDKFRIADNIFLGGKCWLAFTKFGKTQKSPFIPRLGFRCT